MHPTLTLSQLPPVRPAGVAAVAGMVSGTDILTLDGAIAVEHLLPGDRLIVRGGGIARLASLSVIDTESALIRLESQCLGRGRPEGRALVGPDTLLLVRDWRAGALWGQPSAMVPASRLIDGGCIRREPARPVRLFLPVFDTPQVIYAGGLEIGLG